MASTLTILLGGGKEGQHQLGRSRSVHYESPTVQRIEVVERFEETTIPRLTISELHRRARRALDPDHHSIKGAYGIKSILAIIGAITISTSLGSSPVLAAGSSCKYAHNAVDKNSGELVVVVRYKELTNRLRHETREMTGLMSARAEGDRRFLSIQIEYVRQDTGQTQEDLDKSVVVPEGGELKVAMADGSVISLYAYAEVVANTTPGPPGWFTSYATFQYLMDADDMAALMAQPSNAVRIITATGQHDVRFYGNKFNDIRHALECLKGATT